MHPHHQQIITLLQRRIVKTVLEEPEPMKIDLIKTALGPPGPIAASALNRAFAWASHPHGHKFWQEECQNLRKGTPLSQQARAALNILLLEHSQP